MSKSFSLCRIFFLLKGILLMMKLPKSFRFKSKKLCPLWLFTIKPWAENYV